MVVSQEMWSPIVYGGSPDYLMSVKPEVELIFTIALTEKYV